MNRGTRGTRALVVFAGAGVSDTLASAGFRKHGIPNGGLTRMRGQVGSPIGVRLEYREQHMDWVWTLIGPGFTRKSDQRFNTLAECVENARVAKRLVEQEAK